MVHTLVAFIALATFVFAASACTAYKAREADRNEGGGSSMYRATDSARTH